MNKEFNHRNYPFNMKVELNKQSEKRIGGKRWHEIITNCMAGDNYYKKVTIEDAELESAVQEQEDAAKAYIDNLLDKNPGNKRLIALGFK